MTATVSSRSESNLLTCREIMALGLDEATSQAYQEAVERYEQTHPTSNSRDSVSYTHLRCVGSDALIENFSLSAQEFADRMPPPD